MRPREALLERRKQYLRAKIAAQRSQLAWELDAFRGPLRAFEVARSFGEKLRRNAPLVGAIAAFLGFAVMRGGVFSRAVRTLRIANKTTRWLAIARVGLQFVRRWRGLAV
jgi:hypothetical protein